MNKKPYPMPVFFGQVNKAGIGQVLFTPLAAQSCTPLFEATSFPLLVNSIVVVDATTHKALADRFRNSCVYIWQMRKGDSFGELHKNNNNYYSIESEGGWRKLLFHAMQEAGRMGVESVCVYGESRLMRLVLPYAYDFTVVNVNNLELWESFKSISRDFTAGEEFVLTRSPVASYKASHYIGAVEEFNFGRIHTPKDTYYLKEEFR